MASESISKSGYFRDVGVRITPTVEEAFIHAKNLDEQLTHDVGLFLRNNYTPKTAEDYFDFRRDLAERLSGPDGRRILRPYAQAFYDKHYGMRKGVFVSEKDRHYAHFPSENQDLERILLEDASKRDLAKGLLTVMPSNSDKIVKGYHDDSDLLKRLAKRHSYIKKRNNVNTHTEKINDDFSLDFGAAWIGKFDLYRDGEIRDATKEEDMMGFTEIKEWPYAVGHLAGFGLPSWVREARWFDKNETFTKRSDGKPLYFYIEGKKEDLQQMSIKNLQNLISTFPIRFFADYSLNFFDVKRLNQWREANGKGTYSAKEMELIGNKNTSLWKEARVRGGAHFLKHFLEYTDGGKIMYLVHGSGHTHPQAKPVLERELPRF